jgi:hypothetical protein
MYKRLPCFQVYGRGKIIVNLVRRHEFIITMWCEQYIAQYISSIMSTPQLKNKATYEKLALSVLFTPCVTPNITTILHHVICFPPFFNFKQLVFVIFSLF